MRQRALPLTLGAIAVLAFAALVMALSLALLGDGLQPPGWRRRPAGAAPYISRRGAIAQLVERCNRTAEVRSSILLGSTKAGSVRNRKM